MTCRKSKYDQITSDPTLYRYRHELVEGRPSTDEAIARAKLAYEEVENELAAADALCLCEENGIPVPEWAKAGDFIHWLANIKGVRFKKVGRHKSLIRFMLDKHYRALQYLAYKEASHFEIRTNHINDAIMNDEQRSTHYSKTNNGNGIAEFAAQILVPVPSYQCTSQTIERNYRRVRSDLNKGKASIYWYPSSLKITAMITEQREGPTESNDALLPPRAVAERHSAMASSAQSSLPELDAQKLPFPFSLLFTKTP